MDPKDKKERDEKAKRRTTSIVQGPLNPEQRETQADASNIVVNSAAGQGWPDPGGSRAQSGEQRVVHSRRHSNRFIPEHIVYHALFDGPSDVGLGRAAGPEQLDCAHAHGL